MMPLATAANVVMLSKLTPAGLLLLAFVLYQPVLDIGLLADDFALFEWAERGIFAPASWPYFRPAAILSWRGVIELVGIERAPVMIHALNVALHAVNGFLVYRFARVLGCSVSVAVAASLLFITYPTSVEAVTWPSAISDLQLTTLVLLLILSCVRAGDSRRATAWRTALTLVALGTKETAVAIGPLLLLVSLFFNDRRRRSLQRAALFAVFATIAYVAGRAFLGRVPSSHPATLDVLTLTSVLFGPFAALGLPFHESVRRAFPLAALLWMGMLIVILMFSMVRWRQQQRGAGLALLASGWVLLGVAPTIGLFSVGADLQGTRYLYLPTCAWTIALTTQWLQPWTTPIPRKDPSTFGTLGTFGRERRRLPARYWRPATFAMALTICVIASSLHQQHWRRAAAVRDVVLATIAGLPERCDKVVVSAPPDNVNGAYVGRNALPEGVARVHGRRLEFVSDPAETEPECRIDFLDYSRSLDLETW